MVYKSKINLKGQLKFNLFTNSSVEKSEGKDNTLASLYKSVQRSTLVQVYQKYKFDYEMFGYDFNNVLKLGGHEPLTSSEEYMPMVFSGTQLNKLLTIPEEYISGKQLKSNQRNDLPSSTRRTTSTISRG